MVLYELCTLQRAFPGSNIMAVMYRIVEGERPELPATVSPDLRVLFSKMLEKDPRKRPSAVTILQEPFLQQRMEVRAYNGTVCVFSLAQFYCAFVGCLQSLKDKLASQLAPVPSSPPPSSSSPSFPLREAEDIARAL